MSSVQLGWGAGIRTPIGRSRICSPTVRRLPMVSKAILPFGFANGQDSLPRGYKIAEWQALLPRLWQACLPRLRQALLFSLSITYKMWFVDQKDIILHDGGEPQGEWRVDRDLLFESAKEVYPNADETHYKSQKAVTQVEWIINHPNFPNYIQATENLQIFEQNNTDFVIRYNASKDPNNMFDSSLLHDSRYSGYLKLMADKMTATYQIAQARLEYPVFTLLGVAEVYTKKAKIIFM